jgi:head-tail adaptor
MEEGGFPVSLLTQMMEECRILNHVRADDDFGGYTDTWTEGATFNAAIAKNASPEQQIAEKEGITEAFTVVVQQDFTLDYHDVFKRVRDNAIFRVTSRTTDSTAHPASTVKIAKVTAERWVLPS